MSSSIYKIEYNTGSMNITPEIVCQDLMSLVGRFKQELVGMAEERGLTHVQIAALYMLQQRGELAMGKVAQELHCDPSNVTGIIDRLVSHKLVTRQECVTDRRTKTITLTPEGHKIIKELRELMPERLGCSALTDAELNGIHSAAAKMRV